MYSKVLSLRSQPIGPLLQRLERVAFDTSRQLRKKVRVELQGAENEFDKAVLDSLYDPLMHIVRNAIDHGIESAEDRASLGKAEVASLLISVAQEANRTCISVEDDGAGIAKARVLSKAIEKGLADPAKQYSENDIFRMLLLPGFSTKEQVSDISGRGVGLDVVNQSIALLGGDVNISSSMGKGTKFTIYLPISFNIIDALMVKVGGQIYAVPCRDVSEILQVQKTYEDASGYRKIFVREEVLPLIPATEFLNLKRFQEPVTQSLDQQNKTNTAAVCDDSPASGQFALVIKNSQVCMALGVEEIKSQGQIVLSACPDRLNHAGFFQGNTILSSGEPAFILNVTKMASTFHTKINYQSSFEREINYDSREESFPRQRAL